MKSFIYPFDSLNPDLGDRGSSGLLAAINVNPVSGMYCPGPSVQQIREFATSGPTAINNQIVAMYPHDELIFTACRTGQKLYGGDVYGITMNEEEYEVTPTSGWDSTPASNEWNYAFASYGDTLVAAAPDNKLVYMSASAFRTSPTTENFEFESTFGSGKVSGSFSPEAKHIVTHGGHLVAAGITVDSDWNSLTAGTYDYLVWWSGFDDPLSFGSYAFTPEVLGSDYKFLYDTPGGITGMVSAGDYLFVFKDNYI